MKGRLVIHLAMGALLAAALFVVANAPHHALWVAARTVAEDQQGAILARLLRKSP